MTYELAKELRDTGYEGSILPVNLSELIKACGDGFETLQRHRGTGSGDMPWIAGLGKDHKYKGVMGETPEEAVARLWLALNQK